MARVPVTEVFFRNSVPPTLRRDLEVFLYKRGTSEKAPIFTAETGGEERAQPLVTDEQGRVKTNLGGTPWVAVGKYTFKGAEGTGVELQWEGAPGAEGGGGGSAVESVNGQTGVVTLTASNVGADTSGAAAAAQAASQPLNSGLTSISALTTSAYGRGLLTAANLAAIITNGSLTAAMFGAEVVEAAAIKAGNVTESKLAEGAVSATKLATNAVEAAKIKAEAVTAEKLATGSVTEAKLGALAVTEGKLAANAVSEGKLATAVQTKLTGAEKESRTFSMPAGTEAKAETLGEFWQGVATGETLTLVEAKYKIASGTKAKFSIKQNGTAVTGFKELSATTTVASSTGTVSVANGDLFALAVETIEGTPKGLSVTLIFESHH